MKIFIRILISVAAIVALYRIAQVNWSNLDASGVVRDYVTKRPIAGAKLTLDCKESHWHGSSSIRTVETVSSQDGRYSFRFADSWDCDYVVVIPEKEGYKNPLGLGLPNTVVAPFGASVPKYSWLVANSDETRLRLEGWLANSRAVRLSPAGPMPLEDYMMVFRPFAESKLIATDPQDIAWVRTQYCERLTDLSSKTSPQDRERLANSAYGAAYEIHVGPYCKPK
ncbi:MAG TPA: carboxypeptidase-like regulatory domain-containing protein [Steroidobacter sp.]